MRKGERTRSRVVEAAGRVFRRSGIGAGVDTVMAEAELTHGSFYRYFDSKQALVEEALTRAIGEFEALLLADVPPRSVGDRLARVARNYLSRQHRDDAEHGCPLPGLLAEVSRMDDPHRTAIGDRISLFVDRVAAACGDDRSRVVGALATCVGGMLLARGCHGQALSDEVLRASRAAIAGANRPSSNEEKR